ncbi:MAG: hypothetical protein QM737_02595 [Ferruginibacter sp.]
MNKKTITLLLLVVAIAFNFSCKKENGKEKNLYDAASIIGFDASLCGCCGGLIIDISGQQQTKLISNDPANLGIDSSTIFPVAMNIEWAIDSTKCVDRYIIITNWE